MVGTGERVRSRLVGALHNVGNSDLSYAIGSCQDSQPKQLVRRRFKPPLRAQYTQGIMICQRSPPKKNCMLILSQALPSPSKKPKRNQAANRTQKLEAIESIQ